MGNLKEHEIFSKLLTGKKYTQIHKLMDSAVFLFGNKHRIFGHGDPLTIAYVYFKYGEKGLLAYLSHLILDYSPTLQNVIKMLSYLDLLNESKTSVKQLSNKNKKQLEKILLKCLEDLLFPKKKKSK